jgi:hypothetical protein
MTADAIPQRARGEDGATGTSGPEVPRYEPNPKHKDPWQRGARGSLCPKMLIHPPCSRRASSTRCIQVRDTLRTVIVHTVVRSITLDSGMVIPSNGERFLPRSSGSGELAARSVGGG